MAFVALKRRLGAVRVVLEETSGSANHASVSKIQANAVIALIAAASDMNPEERTEITEIVLRLQFAAQDMTTILGAMADGIVQPPSVKRRRGHRAK